MEKLSFFLSAIISVKKKKKKFKKSIREKLEKILEISLESETRRKCDERRPRRDRDTLVGVAHTRHSLERVRTIVCSSLFEMEEGGGRKKTLES